MGVPAEPQAFVGHIGALLEEVQVRSKGWTTASIRARLDIFWADKHAMLGELQVRSVGYSTASILNVGYILSVVYSTASFLSVGNCERRQLWASAIVSVTSALRLAGGAVP